MFKWLSNFFKFFFKGAPSICTFCGKGGKLSPISGTWNDYVCIWSYHEECVDKLKHYKKETSKRVEYILGLINKKRKDSQLAEWLNDGKGVL